MAFRRTLRRRGTGYVNRLRRLLLAPPADVPPSFVSPEAPQPTPSLAPGWLDPDAPSLAVLAPARQLTGVGAAVALAFARHRRARVALMCHWSETVGQASGRLALPGAVRLATSLAARGHVATASGRLVAVSLPADPAEAAGAAASIAAAVSTVPKVLALAGRHEPFEELLTQQHAILAVLPADAPAGLGGLVAADAGDRTPAATIVDVRLGLATRTLARAGLLAPRAIDLALTRVLA